MQLRTTFLGALTLMFASLQTQAAFSSLYVFGDSLSDNGNVFAALGGQTTNPPFTDLIPSKAYASRTFSNGPVWVNLVDDVLVGGTVMPSLLGGTNFAFGGARTGVLTGVSTDIIPTLQQQADAAVSVSGGNLPTDALYVVWGGANDVRAAVEFGQNPQAALQVIADGVENLGEIIDTLAQHGAQKFLVPNVANLGLTPVAAAGGQIVQVGSTTLAETFNFSLTQLLPGLANTLNIDIITVDVFSLGTAVVANPGDFGFTNATDPCHFANGGQGCTNPDEFFYWDGLHPTSQAHRGLADAFLSAVPVPAALPLLLSAIAALGCAAGRASVL